MPLSLKRLQDVLTYDTSTGLFWWRVSPARPVKAGAVAGSIGKDGYRVIGIDGRVYLAHRLAFLYMTGAFPVAEVDHINGDRADNRWQNLRPATRAQNEHNKGARNRLGVKGVSRNHNGFKARIWVNGKDQHLGYFATIDEAKAAYDRAANDLHGEYARSA